MRAFAVLGLALPLVAAKVSYDGYKAFHINAPDDYDDVEAKLKGINYVSMACESNHKGFDIAVSPDSLAAFEDLGLKVDVLHEDLGADMALEGDLAQYTCAYNTHPRTENSPTDTFFSCSQEGRFCC